MNSQISWDQKQVGVICGGQSKLIYNTVLHTNMCTYLSKGWMFTWRGRSVKLLSDRCFKVHSWDVQEPGSQEEAEVCWHGSCSEKRVWTEIRRILVSLKICTLKMFLFWVCWLLMTWILCLCSREHPNLIPKPVPSKEHKPGTAVDMGPRKPTTPFKVQLFAPV